MEGEIPYHVLHLYMRVQECWEIHDKKGTGLHVKQPGADEDAFKGDMKEA